MTAQAVWWVGVCDLCGEMCPEMRESQELAEQDEAECPCRDGAA